MDIISINKQNLRIIRVLINVLGMLKYFLFDRIKYGKIIKNNQKLCSHKSSDTCFIIGNGPSLKNVDLSVLMGKDVITVNKSITTPVFEILKPKFHIMMDADVIEEVRDATRKLLENNKYETCFIFHRRELKCFRQYKRTFFVYNIKQASSYKSIEVDMTKNMTCSVNVLPFAILCAIYIGYKKIILLGNDFSFFATRKNAHYYEEIIHEKKSATLYQDLAGGSIAVDEYQNIYDYASKRQIEIVNCTEGSLLDVIPQRNLEKYI